MIKALSDEMNKIKGVGPKKYAGLKRMGINTIEDFLNNFPRGYEDRRNRRKISSIREGETVLIRGKVLSLTRAGFFGKKRLLILKVGDESGIIDIVFFHGIYLEKMLIKGKEYQFYGRVDERNNVLQMIHPDFDEMEEGKSPGILPVYSLTAGISQKEMRRWAAEAIKGACLLQEYLPQEIISRNNLCHLSYAFKNIHFPQDGQKLREAKYRLVFDELFLLQTALFLLKNNEARGKEGIKFSSEISLFEYEKKLPFSLTNAQKRVLKQICLDMESGKVMNRLVQGDVGSGKTAVAAGAIYKAVMSGYQAVLMAPTEILAHQHYQELSELFDAFDINVGFLSGSGTQSQRKETLERLKMGEIQILIGTHALIQPNVKFFKLGLVVTDEQHRFGVNQRRLLSEKGMNPHVLVMTATPIPRTLAFIIYGDLDISIIDEMPPGRIPVITKTVDKAGREQAYNLINKEMKEGKQVYVVAPLIEESLEIKSKSAKGLYEEMQIRFPDVSVAILHGAMERQEKDAIMENFYNGHISLLISTVIIEVGVNVPNATVMLIENAERFGLAQLHQLRGRVGRGREQSYCILVTDSESEIAKLRAETMKSTSDGFLIAEKDLELRGPGEFFGLRQHGLPDLKVADLGKHMNILGMVKEEAERLLESDPQLMSGDNKKLKLKIEKTFKSFENAGV
ncbi:MAG: ATP-dependent DNA helicase RecG [Anaerovoracaceae bacterium]|jgi:ATP-dependent DNA helicase RecG